MFPRQNFNACPAVTLRNRVWTLGVAFSVINDIHIIHFAQWHNMLIRFILLGPQFPRKSAHILVFDKTTKIQSVDETRSTVKCFNFWGWYASGTCMAVRFFTILLLCKITFLHIYRILYNTMLIYAVTLYQNSNGVWFHISSDVACRS